MVAGALAKAVVATVEESKLPRLPRDTLVTGESHALCAHGAEPEATGSSSRRKQPHSGQARGPE